MKMRILFVDDELRVLEGLRRMLYGMRSEWEMCFAESAEKALEMLSQQKFDVIVTDMRMPGMNGAELLAEVTEKYPDTIRFILSGHSDQHLVLKSVGCAHQYLSKPCDADTLKNAVKRASDLRKLLADDAVGRLAKQIRTLPSFPQVYLDLMEELRSPETSIQRIGEIISRDIGMTAKVLQLVNSAFFGLPRRITDPAQAVSLLGLEVIKGLVFTVHIFSQLKVDLANAINSDKLWRHSMNVGRLAKRIMMTGDGERDGDAFVAGMLHDAGKLMLAANLPQDYIEVGKMAESEGVAFFEAEKRIFGISHAEIGGYLMGLWAFPDNIVEALAYHHNPGLSAAKDLSLVLAVHVADALDHEFGNRDSGSIPQMDLMYLESIGFSSKLPIWREVCLQELQKEGIEDEQESSVC